MMDAHDDEIMGGIDPSPDFTRRVLARVEEVEGVRDIARAHRRYAWQIPLACFSGALLLAWLITMPFLPAVGALMHTAFGLLDAVAPRTALTPLPLVFGALLGMAIGLAWSLKSPGPQNDSRHCQM